MIILKIVLQTNILIWPKLKKKHVMLMRANLTFSQKNGLLQGSEPYKIFFCG